MYIVFIYSIGMYIYIKTWCLIREFGITRPMFHIRILREVRLVITWKWYIKISLLDKKRYDNHMRLLKITREIAVREFITYIEKFNAEQE